MIRIVEESTMGNTVTLLVEGRIVDQCVGVLRISCERACENNGHLVLDLAGVSFADREGVQLLQELERRNVTLINCSPFLREQLKQTTKGLRPSKAG
jgi:hypothetical protein